MEYYEEIKNELISNKINKQVKDYSKNRYELQKYYNVGKLLSEAGKSYGDKIIKEYSISLTNDLNTRYNVSSLHKMRKFYHLAQKVATLSPLLSYSHYVELLSCNDLNKIRYYIQESIQKSLSVRQLRLKIKSNEYERLPKNTKNSLSKQKTYDIIDFVKNPIIIKNRSNQEIASEKVLQRLILEDIPSFLDELGEGFTFIKNEYKIKIDNRYNYIDLLLYNIKYKCYVVIELKNTELKKEHTGQIMTYMNFIDDKLKTIEENKTVGIIICKQDNKYVIKYCSDNRITSRKYEIS